MLTTIHNEMKKFYMIIIAFVLLTLTMGCPEDLRQNIIAYLEIKNNSANDIVYLPWYLEKNYVNDSIFSPKVIPWDNIGNYTLRPGTYGTYGIKEVTRDKMEYDINLVIFIFNSDTLSQVPWERIARENIILKRVDFHSWQELEDCNFEVAYP
jgi:hypothetical protein